MNFIRKIKNIISWLPILWKDEDFDYSYFLYIVEFKLNKIADHMEKHNFHTESLQRANEIREAVKCLSNYQNAFSVLEQPESAVASFDGGQFISNIEFGEYCNKVSEFEKANWEKAWNMIRDNCQCWWC